MICILKVIHCVFEKFRKMCVEIYQMNPEKFLSTPGLTGQAALERNYNY